MNLKDKLNLGASVLAGGLAVYASEKFGLTDFIVNYQIDMVSSLGEKEFARIISPGTKLSWDIGAFVLIKDMISIGLEELEKNILDR